VIKTIFWFASALTRRKSKMGKILFKRDGPAAYRYGSDGDVHAPNRQMGQSPWGLKARKRVAAPLF
jgi:hypothetical protein